MVTLNISTTKALKTKSKVTGDNWRWFVIAAIALTGAFALPLWNLAQYGLETELYSHCWLIPLVSAYLIWTDRGTLVSRRRGNSIRILAIIPAAFAVLLIVLFQVNHSVWVGDLYENTLSSSALAYVFSIYAAAILCLGPSTIRKIAFPLAVGLFTAPFPVPFKDAIITFFQYTSAEAAYWMLKLAGNTIYRDGLVFVLPSVTMEVAPQCSGIRSSLVLFLVSLVASQLFLKTAWKKISLVIFVIPLAIGRNGLRIFTLGELCERVGPHMIDHWIHHSGGPIFFVLSLTAFFAFLLYLVSGEPITTR